MNLPKLPEPTYDNAHRAFEDSFSTSQMLDYGQQCALAERGACAKVLIDNANMCTEDMLMQRVLLSNAEAIRARSKT